MDARDFRREVIRPVLAHLGVGAEAGAEVLLLGTALHESGGLRWLRQRGGGPARGLYQMEPATHDDLWANWLAHRPELAARLAALMTRQPPHAQLVTNLGYATAMARIHYLRVPAALPPAGEPAALARYWKAYYNTPSGAGTVEAFLDAFHRHAS